MSFSSFSTSSSLVSPPTITDSVVQSFFVEALNGSLPPISYLDRFPDSVYTKALDSLLVQFMYTLLGPVGVGLLRQEYLEARLEIEQAGLIGTSLDNLYSNVFAFARLANETYQLDADAALLPAAQQSEILTSDASFRNRAVEFLKGARGGTTLRGLTLVAKSGLNRPVELIENYQALFDHYLDAPLWLPTFGTTSSVAEVIVIPRQTLPQSSVQSLSFTGNPTQGWFTLSYPAGQNWIAIPVSTVAGSSTITVPSVANAPVGAFVTLTNLATTSTSVQIDPTQTGWNHGTLYAQSNGGTGTSVSLVQNLSGLPPGSPALAPATGNFIALVGLGQTIPLPFNAIPAQVQSALTSLPLIGTGNVIVSGGPLPNLPINIQFSNQLSDRPVPFLIANLAPDKATGITAATVGTTQQLSNILNNPLGIVANTSQTTVGAGVDSQATTISAADMHNLYAALNQTRPVTSLFTTQMGTSDTLQQTPSNSFTGSNQIQVLRYVTGRAIQWAPLDATHWIEGGVEHEAPTAYGGASQYQGFHNLFNVTSYTDLAFSDPNYGSSTTLGTTYWNSLIGSYSQGQLALYPGLSALNANNYTNQYLPVDAEAAQAEPLVISTLSGSGIINDIYPVDYLSMPSVPQPTGGLLWASSERALGIDVLEIDLGVAQAVNYLYFEATNKPYSISVDYDTLDQSPNRYFTPVTIAPGSAGPSVTSLNYHATQLWSTVTLNFTNQLGGMIYTRFIRILFTKTPVGTPYGPMGTAPIPYSVEVQNLRAGRNVS